MYEEDTIAAIATPPGEGGIAIIRISGAGAENIASKIFARAHGKNGRLASHRLYHGAIYDPTANGKVDEVLLTIMRKPHSYTGEDGTLSRRRLPRAQDFRVGAIAGRASIRTGRVHQAGLSQWKNGSITSGSRARSDPRANR